VIPGGMRRVFSLDFDDVYSESAGLPKLDVFLFACALAVIAAEIAIDCCEFVAVLAPDFAPKFLACVSFCFLLPS